MNARQYIEALEQLGLTKDGPAARDAAVAELLGIHERTSRKYALGERPVPLIVQKFLQHLLARGA